VHVEEERDWENEKEQEKREWARMMAEVRRKDELNNMISLMTVM
jgi:hypothetical protein